MPKPPAFTQEDPAERVDSRRNRRKLIEAATVAIAEKGLEVSALDIANRAEVGVGTLYRRFGTKEMLIDEVLLSLVDELLEHAEEALADADPWRGFADYLTALGRAQIESRGLAELTGAKPVADSATPAITASASLLEPLNASYIKLRRLTQQIVQRAQAHGAMRSDISWRDVVLLSRAQVDATDCLGTHARDEQWNRTVAVLLDGLRTPGQTPLPGRAPMDTFRSKKP
jgi:AcrR family transcriptional regulator